MSRKPWDCSSIAAAIPPIPAPTMTMPRSVASLMRAHANACVGSAALCPEPSEIFEPDLLAGRVVLVTGGGTNLGLHAAKELHRVGASVVIAGRRTEVLEAARPLVGERCTVASGDIREPEGAAAIVAQALADHGRLDALVNNAGGQYFVPAQDIAAKGWRAVWRLNVDGHAHDDRGGRRRRLRRRTAGRS